MTTGEGDLKSAATLTKDEVIKRLRNLVKITNESPEMGGWTPALSVVEAEVVIGLLEASAPPAAERTALEDIREIALRDMDTAKDKAKERESTASYFHGMAAEAAMFSIAIKLRIEASEGTKSE